MITNTDIANYLDKKGFIIYKSGDAFLSESIIYTDEVVEQNSGSSSGSIAYGSIYRYYISDKSSIQINAYHYNANTHGIRPLFLFKEWYQFVRIGIMMKSYKWEINLWL